MAQEGSSRGAKSVHKNDFTQRFKESCTIWSTQDPMAKDIVKEKEEEDRVKTDSTQPNHKIFGFENEIKSMKSFLLDQKVYKDFKTLVIRGEYGVGKTTLCKTIFNDNDVKCVYAPRIWVSMHSQEMESTQGQEREDKKIVVVKKILKNLGVDTKVFDEIHKEAEQEVMTTIEKGQIDEETMKKKEINALLYALHLNLRWKKYLIVFDDVREEDSWDEKLDEKIVDIEEKWGKYLSDGFPKGSGGRVIYTTREYNLAKTLVSEEHDIHRIWPLSDQTNVWNIYQNVIKEKKKEIPRNDKKCKDELMNKSRGLPLAVRLIAELTPVFLDDEDPADETTNNQTTHSL
ncbi:unnamed protein product [Cochlearia groenlandica]